MKFKQTQIYHKYIIGRRIEEGCDTFYLFLFQTELGYENLQELSLEEMVKYGWFYRKQVTKTHMFNLKHKNT